MELFSATDRTVTEKQIRAVSYGCNCCHDRDCFSVPVSSWNVSRVPFLKKTVTNNNDDLHSNMEVKNSYKTDTSVT